MTTSNSINNIDINSISDQESVKHFSAANWPLSTSGLNAMTPGTTQFAILYNGSMCVYDGIPAEKVHEIMMMASANAKSSEMKSGIPFNSLFSSTTPSSPQGNSDNLPSPPSVGFPAAEKSSICRMQEFPLARRQSLQRFLEKRRIRVRSKAPYTSSSSKAANNSDNNFSLVMVSLEGK
ncbi:putative transcription factor TIFY family [Medicago truncatula]|uniref:Protein TIFY n=2 Tax=Medicago truncatula TaxID=3880 RepID=G7JR45_MEDTR|nr:protein TIFY 3 [Medicago truncatula]AES92112.1 divergent CCT motif protein [Medicago truncatula]AFK42364.1 unknown [Medicago truncatula]RHN64497.1 putative transcription factor TIFY family [Medicago truncatula]